jgi:hypothetical protein
MIGLWGDAATTFLIVVAGVTMITFALPLTFAPLRWARAFGWRLPDDTDLAVYFGRCLGVIALAVHALALTAAISGVGVELVFKLLIAGWALLTLVHVWGALRRLQPASESWEIAFWAPLVVLGLLFYPA